jgi:hypothetical protein
VRRATLVVYLALAAVAAIAAAAASNDKSTRNTIVTETSGAFSFANSREGMPIFTATNIGPGDSAKGTVEIANEGSETLAVTLAQRDLSDVPGAGGGDLSQRLSLKITAGPSVIYAGPLATMPSLSLGTLAPGASRQYEFAVAFFDGGPSNAATVNTVQGSSTSVTYSWTASEAPPAPESPSAPSSTSPTTPRAPSPSPSSSQTPPLSAHLVGYRSTLRNGRIVAWVRCNEACRVRSYITFLAPSLPGELPATAHHAQRRRFGARTRRLAVRLPGAALRLLSGVEATARIVVVSRSRGGEVTETSALLHLRSRSID